MSRGTEHLELVTKKLNMRMKELGAAIQEVQKDIEGIHVLKAEWSHFNTPERLRTLAQNQLSLESAKPEQIINYSALQFNYEDSQNVNRNALKHKNLTTLVKAVKK